MPPTTRLLLLALLLAGAPPMAAEVAVVAHPGVVLDAIDSDTLQAMYLNKKRQWPDDTPVQLCLNDDAAIHDTFLDVHVGKSSGAYTSYWKRIVFTGKGAMPDALPDDAAVLAFVARTPGAIGYVAADRVGQGVKRLAVH